MKNIISKFYVIKINDTPIYVGFTNRTLKQRLREHKIFKNIPEDATITEIFRKEYNFSWDIEKVYSNAKEVSDLEAGFIKKYQTQSSEYQKAIGGGQVWTEIKGFVHTHKNDMFWKSIPDDIVIETINDIERKKVRTKHIVGHTVGRMHGVVKRTNTNNRLGNTVSFTSVYNQQRINIINTVEISHGRLLSSVRNTQLSMRINNSIKHTLTGQKISNNIRHTRTEQRLQTLTKNTKDKEDKEDKKK